MTPSPHTQPRGFQPVKRTTKREGDFRYIYDRQRRDYVPVPVVVQ